MAEIIFDQMELDTGYGVVSGDLHIDCYPVNGIESFDAYGLSGSLKTFTKEVLEDVQIGSAIFFIIGNNGEDLGEVFFEDEEELLKAFPKIKESLMEWFL